MAVSGLRFEAFCIARSLPGVKVRETQFSTPAFRGILVTAPDKSKAIIVLNNLPALGGRTNVDLTHDLCISSCIRRRWIRRNIHSFYEWQANEKARRSC